jgi:hypothetical protein
LAENPIVLPNAPFQENMQSLIRISNFFQKRKSISQRIFSKLKKMSWAK